ncbi:hypothetical protein F3Y22_tig00110388pilonHSYRG00241 [Hibiscus syriacus]|uniref:Uncharacterized protein n=1 Tax=Hibiscus syriacus TaxID=106335 RepID=A0A6A3AR99_HIBSY|nr:hypothetical protein F3Y22_tig00110388pilonHSYRG00241 [Hibiscus syriacus]
MASYPTIIRRWWLLAFSGFVVVLLFVFGNSRDGYNISVLQNMRDMQSPNKKEPPESSHLFFNLELKPCTLFNLTYTEKPATSSSSSSSQDPLSAGLKNAEPWKNFVNVKPIKIEERCNVFEGKWVYDPVESPLYNSAMCPFLSDRASCQGNGRPDKEYERWRWEANECKIPTFDAKDFLETLREFLVEVLVNKTSGKKILNLDALSPAASKSKGADIMVFNTGHWWDWFLFKQKLYTDMKLDRTFKLAMRTWGCWIEKNVDTSRTTVFFWGMSPAHLRRHRKPVRYVNITRLTELRKDAHSSIYWKKKQFKAGPDCSHWCLPGVPDTWNHLLYATLAFDASWGTSNTRNLDIVNNKLGMTMAAYGQLTFTLRARGSSRTSKDNSLKGFN